MLRSGVQGEWGIHGTQWDPPSRGPFAHPPPPCFPREGQTELLLLQGVGRAVSGRPSL